MRDRTSYDDIEPGQRWQAMRNPYPGKGIPDQTQPWPLQDVYTIRVVSPSDGQRETLIGFDGPKGETWDCSLSTFRHGFEKVEYD